MKRFPKMKMRRETPALLRMSARKAAKAGRIFCTMGGAPGFRERGQLLSAEVHANAAADNGALS